jgi:AcrR family transcriptional regulator
MSASATKSRILAAGRELFNLEGYAAQSAVDLAVFLGISPGHLYYHFKGKADIAYSLIEDHLVEIASICENGLKQCLGTNATIENVWTQVHILIEEIYDMRFAYREASFLARSEARFRTQINCAGSLIDNFCKKLIDALIKSGEITAKPEIIDGLVAQLALGIEFQHMRLENLLPQTTTPRALVERAAAIVMLPIVGFSN